MLKQKFLLSYSSQLLSSLIGVVISLFVARICGPTVMGLLAYGAAFASVFRFVIDLGLNNAHIKIINEPGNEAEKRKVFSVLKSVALVIYIVCIIVTYTTTTFATKEQKIVVIIWMCVVFIEGINSIPLTSFVAKTERVKVDIPVLFQNLLTKLSRISLAIMGFGAIALSITNLFFSILLIPFYYKWYLSNNNFGSFRWDIAKAYLLTALPLLIYSLISSFYHNVDRLMLERFADVKEVGYYAIGFSFALPVEMLGTAVSGIFFPVFSSMVVNNKWGQINKLINDYTWLLICCISPLVMLLSVLTPFYVPIILGEKYIPAIASISILIVGLFFKTVGFPLGNLIFGMGKFIAGGLLQFLSLSVLVISLFFFLSNRILNLGAVGASISMVIAYSTLIIIYIIYLKTKAKSNFMFSLKASYILILILNTVVGFAFYKLIDDGLIINAVIMVGAYCSLYYLILLKSMSIEHKQLLRKTINLKELIAYLKTKK